MEYIELEIKRIIYDLLEGKVVPYSIELDCELPGTNSNKLYGTNVYVGEEKDDMISVEADFSCRIKEEIGYSDEELNQKGKFKGIFNVAHKCFADEGACEVRF